jgi:transcriptional regulator with XRE-family HTH domain
MDISKVLANRRDERGISYAELARRTDINPDVLARIMKGRATPKGDQLIVLCQELGLDLEDFIPTNR